MYKKARFTARVAPEAFADAQEAVRNLKTEALELEMSLEEFQTAFDKAVEPKNAGADAVPMVASPLLRVSFLGEAFRARVSPDSAAVAQTATRTLAKRARFEKWSVEGFEEGFYALAALHGAVLDSDGAHVQLEMTFPCGSVRLARVFSSCQHRARAALRALRTSDDAKAWDLKAAKQAAKEATAPFRKEKKYDPEEKIRLTLCYSQGTFRCSEC